jgi:hypothetical protein
VYAAEHPSVSPVEAPTDVIVLMAPPRSTSCEQLLRTIAELKSGGRAAVLVVFPHLADTETFARASTAGADLCVVAPTSGALFSCIERARSAYRLAARDGTERTRRLNCRRSDEVLDTLWRKRSHRESS